MSAQTVFDLCVKKGFTMGFAESMTGGKAIAAMIEIPGASKIVLGGITAYSRGLKESLLKVSPKVIDTYGIVSSEVADDMALGIKMITSATISVGITGNAGPDKQKDSLDLSCYITILMGDHKHQMHLIFDQLTRTEAIQYTVDSLYEKLVEILS